MSVPLFWVPDALVGVVFQEELKEGGMRASIWFSMKEASSELSGSQ